MVYNMNSGSSEKVYQLHQSVGTCCIFFYYHERLALMIQLTMKLIKKKPEKSP